MKKVRLDQLVFDLGFTESRERAKTTIMSGLVFVNGQRADKPGMPVPPDARVEVRGEAIPFVSRGGFCLLYTSPSPRDTALSRMPSSA